MSPIQKRAERVRAIPLESVLRRAGAQPDPQDRHKWHASMEVFSITGTKFMNWTRGIGGGGAIDLVIHLTQRGFMEALNWLEQSFPDHVEAFEAPCHTSLLQLPAAKAQNLWRIKGYLVAERSLPEILIDPLINSGLLYADSRANAVFLLRGENNQPVGAELRGTTHRSWRGMAPGSRKDLGYFSIGPTSTDSIILCESAIDALSCFILHPKHRCLSTSGARPKPRWLASLISQNHQILCGFDADPVGDAMAQVMIQLYPSIQRLRPPQKDWNELLKSK